MMMMIKKIIAETQSILQLGLADFARKQIYIISNKNDDDDNDNDDDDNDYNDDYSQF